ncbi:MAG: hypothetical protein IJ870_02430 [Alphaproteobacteria bacterium]|nr:hypothetical protein [Alphaproteobacteria bacterium]
MKNYKIIRESFNVFAKQKQGITNSKGRSMVEILGVLAIIGVLSAGALAGYNKAMMQHKLNKNAEEVGYLLSTVIYNSDKLKDASFSLISELKALGALKEDIRTVGEGTRFYDSLQNEVWFEHPLNDFTAYCIYLPQSDFRVQVCLNYINVFKSFADDLDIVEVMQAEKVDESGNNRVRKAFAGQNCNTGNCLATMTNSDILSLCHDFCSDAPTCILYAFWDLDEYTITHKITNSGKPYKQ